MDSNADNSVVSDTDPTDVDTSRAEDDEEGGCAYDQACLFADERHPPKHYL